MTERISSDASATDQAVPVDCGPPTSEAELRIKLTRVDLSLWQSISRKIFKRSASQP